MTLDDLFKAKNGSNYGDDSFLLWVIKHMQKCVNAILKGI